MKSKPTIIATLVIGLSLSFPGSLLARDKTAQKDVVPPPPTMSKKGVSRKPVDPDELEPEVRIVPKEDVMHEEYRVNGRLYKIKVIPKKGKPYYLFDPDGKGEFTRSDLEPDISIPTWVIKRF